MKQYLSAAAALLITVVPNLQAGELLAEPVPTAYVSMSFGGGTKATSSYGLQLARLESDAQQGVMLFDGKRSAYLDVKFSQGDLSGLSLNGTDFVALARQQGYNANGENSVQQWWGGLSDNQKAFFAVAGIAAIGCLADWCQGGGGGHSEPRKRLDD
jgi:hypothetical protein